MSGDSDLGRFLKSRRARLQPTDVGLPASTTLRRSPGLRREDVAVLAGVSVDYYARLEQGRIGTVSDQVLAAIEDALRLDQLERDHFRRLVRPSSGRRRRAPAERLVARAGLVDLVEALDPIPAMVQSRRMDVLAINRAGRVLLTDFDQLPAPDRNIVRWLFTDPVARRRYPDWTAVASMTVASLRATRDPQRLDPALERLVSDLTEASSEFATWWSDYRLHQHSHGPKQIFHDAVGTMDLSYESLQIPDSGGQTLTLYTAAQGSTAHDKLRLLLSWDATPTLPTNR